MTPESRYYTPGSYAWFHFANKGKVFKTPEGIRTKLDVYTDYHKNPDFLISLTNGKIKDCLPINKSQL